MFIKSGRNKFYSCSLIFLIVILFLTAFVMAADSFKQWEAVNLRHPIRIDGAVDANILANITIKDPDNIVIVNFSQMTYDPISQEHNFSILAEDAGKIGTYEYTITATGSGLNETGTFNFKVTPSGETGLLGFYFLAIILSYGVMGFGINKGDITITMLGTFALFFLGIYIMFNGLDVYKNFLTEGFSIITLGVAFYVSAKAAHEYITA